MCLVHCSYLVRSLVTATEFVVWYLKAHGEWRDLKSCLIQDILCDCSNMSAIAKKVIESDLSFLLHQEDRA